MRRILGLSFPHATELAIIGRINAIHTIKPTWRPEKLYGAHTSAFTRQASPVVMRRVAINSVSISFQRLPSASFIAFAVIGVFP
jgi:hypothetical protein